MRLRSTVGRALVLTLGLAVMASACATLAPRQTSFSPSIRESSATVALHGKPLTLHIAQPAVHGDGRPLVLYASGDGGWFGAAVDMWRQMAAAGYAAVGFSSRAFLKIERPKGMLLDPAQVAREYSVIINRARTALGLESGTPVILTGYI